MIDTKAHWEKVYSAKRFDEVSWYSPHLDRSLKMILSTGVPKHAAIIDVGGGSSTLVDDLLDEGFSDVTVLDISEKAIETSRERLGARGCRVKWLETNITDAKLPDDRYDVWHDRAVFHFLTAAEDRRKYVEAVRRAVKPGGHIIIASFGPEGPEKCSGLEVVRYSADEMQKQFGNSFKLIDSVEEEHATPFGTTQEFLYCYCRIAK
jgi:ubiquinone/menaquinone biosynthesis C-methylase UbiE